MFRLYHNSWDPQFRSVTSYLEVSHSNVFNNSNFPIKVLLLWIKCIPHTFEFQPITFSRYFQSIAANSSIARCSTYILHSGSVHCAVFHFKSFTYECAFLLPLCKYYYSYSRLLNFSITSSEFLLPFQLLSIFFFFPIYSFFLPFYFYRLIHQCPPCTFFHSSIP